MDGMKLQTGRRALHTGLSVLLVLAALGVTAWLAFPNLRAAVLNKWREATGRDHVPLVTYAGIETPLSFSCTVPDGFVLDQYQDDGMIYASAQYRCPERSERAFIMITLARGEEMRISVDSENLSVYEELTMDGRDVIYQEKPSNEADGIPYRSAVVSIKDPACYVAINTLDVSREEVFAIVQSLQVPAGESDVQP